MDKNLLNRIEEKVNNIYNSFSSDQDSLISLEEKKCNITKYSSKTLNSKEQLVVPIGYFITELVKFLNEDYFKKFHMALELKDDIFNEIFLKNEKEKVNLIFEFFIKNKEAAEMWRQNFFFVTYLK